MSIDLDLLTASRSVSHRLAALRAILVGLQTAATLVDSPHPDLDTLVTAVLAKIKALST